ncbi:MAG: hypothetical protein FIA99_08595 [Ruminiclostridium sp.]|nr:hypothetical protein [Ruminiclostridium sp.]
MDKNKIKEEKKTMPIYAKYGLIALVILAAIIGGMFIWFNAASSYAAKVGNEKISVKEYKLYLAMQKESMFYQARSLDPSLAEETFWKTKIGSETTLEIAKKRTLEGIGDIKIQIAEAKNSGIKLDASDIKNIDDSIKKIVDNEQVGGGNRIKANKFFEDHYGAGLDVFRKIQLENALALKYKDKIISENNIPENELKAEYDKDPKMYDKVTVTQVLFLYEGKDGKRSREESKKLADDTLSKVKAGNDTKELAKKLSEDPGVTENSGVYTFTKYDNLVPEFIDWALKANVGDSGIVETSYGYHVMKLDKREVIQFNDVKGKIKSDLSTGKYDAKFSEWKKDAKYLIKTNDSVYGSIY